MYSVQCIVYITIISVHVTIVSVHVTIVSVHVIIVSVHVTIVSVHVTIVSLHVTIVSVHVTIVIICSVPTYQQTSHTEVVFVPRCQTKDLGLTAREVTLCYPGDGHTPWFTLAELNKECAWGTLSEYILSISLLNKAHGTARRKIVKTLH